MKDTTINKLAAGIVIAYVIVMLAWGWLDSFGNSWLAAFIGGIIATTVWIIGNGVD